MKPTSVVTVLFVGILLVGFSGEAMSRLPAEGPIVMEGRLNCPYISSSGGRIFLQITLTTRDFVLPERRPMNLCVVLDRSGSMADEGKITYAKKALYALIDQLTERDILSIVIYDHVVEVLSSAKRVGNKAALKRLIERIEPRGNTNLGGGMIEGFRQVERQFDRAYVNRVVLLSDGLANQGITDSWELNRIAGKYRSRFISLTTMGGWGSVWITTKI
jgi:Ca-activated chloride channel family protein